MKQKILLKVSCIILLVSIFSGISFSQELASLNGMVKGVKIQKNSNVILLKNALDEFEAKYNISIAYKSELIEHRNVEVKNTSYESLEKDLANLIKQHGLKFKKIRDNFYVIEKDEAFAPKENGLGSEAGKQELEDDAITVKGQVTSGESGETIPGVNILVKGTATGTVSDLDGYYTLSAPEDGILVFSSIGYITQEVAVNGRALIDVSLEEDLKSLDEVVVVGYGTQRKTDVTGAISSVSSKDIQNRPVTNITEALAGQMAGVQVQQIDGAPGGSGLMVRVRGTGSITAGSSPLYVVDGYPIEGDLSMINPNDIESIQVLKDASATAIYGSRGGNGVVIITTKKGSIGEPKVEFNSYIGLQQVANKVDMMNSQEYVQWFMDGRNNAWIQEGGSADDPNDVRSSINYKIPPEYFNADNLPNTIWQDEIFRTSLMHNYQLSASGGTEKTRYMISGGYIKQDGIIINTDYNRYNLRSDVRSQVSNKIEVGLNVDASMATSNRVENGKYGPVQLSLVVPPTFPVYNTDGSFSSPLASPYSFHMGDDPNPVEIATQIDDVQKTTRTLGQVFAEYKILDGLTFRTKLGGVINQSREKYYRPSYVNRDSNPAPNTVDASSNTSHETDFLLENTLTYDKIINGKHSVNALLGYTRQKHTYEDNYVYATNFPNDNVHTLNNGQVTDGSSRESEFSLISYLARVNYAYNDKYLFTATIRADGSSRFGANNKWGAFPSASFGWRISEEDFMNSVGMVSDLKLRASYGLTGNNAIPNYGSIGLLGVTQYVFGNGLVSGVYPNTISNPNLGWEMTKQFDVGIEFGLLSNRIHMEADYYYRSTKDLLLNVPVPRITGYDSQLQNIGKVRNEGVEFSVLSRNLVGSFKWNTNFNISFNRNKVLALGPDNNPVYASAPNVTNGFITEVGQPIANFFGYIFDGVYLTEEQIEASAHHSTTVPGDPIIRDVNGDGEINSGDRAVIGNNQPDYMYGITNNFSYKNLDLGIQITGTQGGEVFSMSSRFTKYFHGERNARADAVNRWRSPDQPGDGEYFRASRNYTGLQKEPSSYWVQDASFLRIRNVTLGYNLPESLVNNISVQSTRLYLSVQNLFTFTEYFGFDPEVSTSGSGLTRGGDYSGYPTARTFTLGVNVVF